MEDRKPFSHLLNSWIVLGDQVAIEVLEPVKISALQEFIAKVLFQVRRKRNCNSLRFVGFDECALVTKKAFGERIILAVGSNREQIDVHHAASLPIIPSDEIETLFAVGDKDYLDLRLLRPEWLNESRKNDR